MTQNRKGKELRRKREREAEGKREGKERRGRS